MTLSKYFLIVLVLMTVLQKMAHGQSGLVGKSGKDGKVLRKFIDPSELKKIVDNPVDSIWIIDVRSEAAYLKEHIPTAKSFPSSSIMSRLDEIPKNQYLILYCNVGATVKLVSKKLRKARYKRTINWGGISRWEGPTVTL